MFSRQASLVESLRAHLPGAAVDIFRSLMCNSEHTLVHKGPVVFEGETKSHEILPGTKIESEYTALVLAENFDARMRGRILGGAKWALTQEEARAELNDRTQETRNWVSCKKVTTEFGEFEQGPLFDVCLGEDGWIGTDKVIAYGHDPEGTRVAVNQHTYLRYGLVQAGYSNITGGAVSVKLCDRDGTNERVDAFDVQVLDKKGQDIALFTADVIGFMKDVDGDLLCLTDCHDMPFKRVVWTAVDVANIEDGWELCDGDTFGAITTPDLSARFIMCIDEDGQADENTIGDRGGYRNHGPDADNNHTAHSLSYDPGDHLAVEIGHHTTGDQTVHSIETHVVDGHTLATHTIAGYQLDYDPGAHTIAAHTIANHTIDSHAALPHVRSASNPEFCEEIPSAYYEDHNISAHVIDAHAGGAAPGLAHPDGGATDLDHAEIAEDIHAHAGSTLTHAAASLTHVHEEGTTDLAHTAGDPGTELGHTELQHSLLEHDTLSATLAHTATDNRPRYYVLAAIMRVN